MTIHIFIWLFPIIFILHDFEEIIMFKPCQKRNELYFKNKGYKKYPFDYPVTTSAFSIAVMEEFLIISIICILSVFTENYIIWYGTFFAFSFHMFIHILSAIKIKRYIGSTFTSILFFPLYLYILYQSTILFEYTIVIIISSFLICTILMFINVILLQKLMPSFDVWLNMFSRRD